MSMLPPGTRRAAQAARLLSLVLAAWPAAAPAEPMTFVSAVRRAEDRSQDLAARRAALAALREQAVAAGRRPDPVVQAGVNNLPVSGPDRLSLTREGMTMRYVGVMQEWTRGATLDARREKAARDLDVAAAELAMARAAVQREAALAWIDAALQARVVATLAQQVVEAGLQVEAADVALKGGRGTVADAIAARAAEAQARDLLSDARRAAEVAALQLARWSGPGASTDGAMPETRSLPSTASRGGAGADAADEAPVLDGHAELEVAADLEAQARAELAMTRSEQRPDLSLQLMFAQRGPGFGNMVSFGVSMPLPWDAARRQDRLVAAQAARLAQRQAERDETQRAHEAEVRMAMAEWRTGRERLARYDATLVPLAEDRLQAAIAAYRGNAGPLAAVLEARRARLDVQLERLAIEREAARAWTRLDYMVPHGTPDAPGASDLPDAPSRARAPANAPTTPPGGRS